MANVLVVDDDATVREVVVDYLRAAGHEVREAGDGAGALAAHARRRGRPAGPRRDDAGHRRPRGVPPAAASARDVPVILLTALGSEQDRVVGLEIGADDYVTKPFSPRELVLRVDSVLRRSVRRASPDAAAGDGRRRPRRRPRAARSSEDGRRRAPDDARVRPAGLPRRPARAGVLPRRPDASRCGAGPSATSRPSPSTCAGCARRSRPTRPNPVRLRDRLGRRLPLGRRRHERPRRDLGRRGRQRRRSSACSGLLAGWALRHRSLRWQLAVVGVVTTVTVLVGVQAISRRMLISDHDRSVVLIVTSAAAVVSLVVALVLAAALVRWSQSLREDVRRVGAGGSVVAERARSGRVPGPVRRPRLRPPAARRGARARAAARGVAPRAGVVGLPRPAHAARRDPGDGRGARGRHRHRPGALPPPDPRRGRPDGADGRRPLRALAHPRRPARRAARGDRASATWSARRIAAADPVARARGVRLDGEVPPRPAGRRRPRRALARRWPTSSSTASATRPPTARCTCWPARSTAGSSSRSPTAAAASPTTPASGSSTSATAAPRRVRPSTPSCRTSTPPRRARASRSSRASSRPTTAAVAVENVGHPRPRPPAAASGSSCRRRCLRGSAQGCGELDVDVVGVLEGQDRHAGVREVHDLAVLDAGLGERGERGLEVVAGVDGEADVVEPGGVGVEALRADGPEAEEGALGGLVDRAAVELLRGVADAGLVDPGGVVDRRRPAEEPGRRSPWTARCR